MNRRTFVKKIGIGGLLVGLGALAGAGCSRDSGPAATTPEAGDQSMVAVCPNCNAENDVTEWGVEITCWKCGHKWTPEKTT